MGNVRNDVIITQGLNKLLDKGSISLDKLSTHLATKSEAIGGLNSSDVVTEFKNDRYSRNEQVPTELETPKAVETFVKFVATWMIKSSLVWEGIKMVIWPHPVLGKLIERVN